MFEILVICFLSYKLQITKNRFTDEKMEYYHFNIYWTFPSMYAFMAV